MLLSAIISIKAMEIEKNLPRMPGVGLAEVYKTDSKPILRPAKRSFCKRPRANIQTYFYRGVKMVDLVIFLVLFPIGVLWQLLKMTK